MNTYLPQLTWLRGIASVLVIFSHILRSTESIYSNKDTANNYFIYKALDLGTFGVLLFFVLSGCTLYISYSHKIKDYQSTASYMIKRILRIWPAFFISILLYSVFRPIFSSNYITPKGNWIEYQFLSPVNISDYITYLTLTFNHLGSTGKFNNAFWSLPIEFQYYLIFPVLILILKKSKLTGLIFTSLLLYFIPGMATIGELIDTRFFTLSYSFIGGVALGYLYQNLKPFCKVNNTLTLFLITSILALVSSVTNDWIKLPDIIFISNKWNFYGVFAIISVAIVLSWRAKMNSHLAKLLKWLGDISYSAYLYHNLIIGITILFIIKFDLYRFKLIILVPTTLILTLLIAHLSYRYIELFGMRLAKKI